MRLFDNLLGLSGVKVLLVEAEAVEGLVIGSLVPAEPLTDTILDGVGDVIDVFVLLGKGVVDCDCKNLPVELAVVNHSEDAKGFDLGDGAHFESLGADLDDVDGIVIAKDLKLGVLLCRQQYY